MKQLVFAASVRALLRHFHEFQRMPNALLSAAVTAGSVRSRNPKLLQKSI
jgi:hypothetical protein